MDVGVCHGDLHGGNMHIHNGEVAFFDFEECAFGMRAYDLGTFKWDICGGKDGPDRWSAFLRGYSTVRPLKTPDASWLNTIVLLRELAEAAYGVRNRGYFGENCLMVSDVDEFCKRLKRFAMEMSQ